MAKEETKQKAQKQTERYVLDRKADGTLSISIVVPFSDVEKKREEVVTELSKNVEVAGFRKGNVPRNIAEEKLRKETIQEELLKKLLASEYVAAVKKFDIKPIINPRIHVEAFEDGTDLAFTADTCEEPEVKLGDYKTEVKKIKPAAPKIIVPGKEEEKQEENPNKKLDDILEAILKTAKVKIPQVLAEQEANRLLSRLLDELKRLGVSLDQYLQSRGKKDEELKQEYMERAEKDLQLEFLLRKVADEEKITVDESDIEKALSSIKDEQERAQITQNPYLVAAIIRQQKTLDFLSKL